MKKFVTFAALLSVLPAQALGQLFSDENLVESILDFDADTFGRDTPEFQNLLDQFEESVEQSFNETLAQNEGQENATEAAASETLSFLVDPDSPVSGSPLFNDLSTVLNSTVISQTQELGLSPDDAISGLVETILAQDSVENRSDTATNFQNIIGSTFDFISQSEEAPASLLDTVSTFAFNWADAAVQDQLADLDGPDGDSLPTVFFDFNGFIGGVFVQESTQSALDSALANVVVDDVTGEIDPTSLDLSGVSSGLLAALDSLPDDINSFLSPGEAIGSLVGQLASGGFASETALTSVLDLSSELNASLGGGDEEGFLDDALNSASQSFFRSLFPSTDELIGQAAGALPDDILLAANNLANAELGDAVDQIGNLAALQNSALINDASLSLILPDFNPAEVSAFQQTFAAIVGDTLQDQAPENLDETFNTLFEQASQDIRSSAVRSAFSDIYTESVASVIASAAAAGDFDAVQELTSNAVGAFSQNLTVAGEASTGYIGAIDGIVSAVSEVVDLSANAAIASALTSGVVEAAATVDTRNLLVDDIEQIDNIAVVQAADAILTSRLQSAVEAVSSAIVASDAEDAGELIAVVAEAAIVTAAITGQDQDDLISLASAVVQGGQSGVADVLDPGEIGGDIEQIQETVVETFLNIAENNEDVASIVTEPIDEGSLDNAISEGPRQSVPTIIADNDQEIDSDGRIVAPEDFLSAS
ncbi:MAG: hypothetical protein AAGC81_19190 [Pseudomonadota bacterium]